MRRFELAEGVKLDFMDINLLKRNEKYTPQLFLLNPATFLVALQHHYITKDQVDEFNAGPYVLTVAEIDDILVLGFKLPRYKLLIPLYIQDYAYRTNYVEFKDGERFDFFITLTDKQGIVKAMRLIQLSTYDSNNLAKSIDTLKYNNMTIDTFNKRAKNIVKSYDADSIVDVSFIRKILILA
jgi:hypothetical protein